MKDENRNSLQMNLPSPSLLGKVHSTRMYEREQTALYSRWVIRTYLWREMIEQKGDALVDLR